MEDACDEGWVKHWCAEVIVKVKRYKQENISKTCFYIGLKAIEYIWLHLFLFFCLIYQVSLQELEQRRPLLEKQVTAAQNLKNKTSNQDSRNAITERSTSSAAPHAFTYLFLCERLCFLLRNNTILLYVETQLSTWRWTLQPYQNMKDLFYTPV